MRLLKILGGPFYFFFVKHFYYFRKYIYILFPKVNDCFTLTEKHGQLEKVTIYPYEEVRGSDLFSHMPQSKVKISEGAVYFGKGVDFSTMASGVYIQDRQLIPEISDIHRHDFYIKKILKPNFNVLKGKSLVLTSLYANSNYWHWTVDVIALIHLIEKMELDLNSFDNLLIYHTNLPYQDAMIKYLGIDESKVYLIDGKTSYHLEEVVVPFSKTAINQANWKVDFLNQKFVPQKVENSPKNIYISRQGSKRCIANYQNFKKFLRRHSLGKI